MPFVNSTKVIASTTLPVSGASSSSIPGSLSDASRPRQEIQQKCIQSDSTSTRTNEPNPSIFLAFAWLQNADSDGDYLYEHSSYKFTHKISTKVGQEPVYRVTRHDGAELNSLDWQAIDVIYSRAKLLNKLRQLCQSKLIGFANEYNTIKGYRIEADNSGEVECLSKDGNPIATFCFKCPVKTDSSNQQIDAIINQLES